MTETRRSSIRAGEWHKFLYVVGAFSAISVAVQLVAIHFATPDAGTSNVVAQAGVVSNPNDPANAVGYVVYLILGSAFVLALRRVNLTGLLDYFAALFVWDLGAVSAMAFLGLEPLAAAVLGGVFMLAFMRYHPWWLINLSAVVFGAYGAAVLGRTFGLLPAVVLLAGTALYDYVAVFKTKHMLTLAETVKNIDAPLPAILVVPTSWRFFDGSDGGRDLLDDENAVAVGLGDFVIPAVLAVSAAVYWASAPGVELAGVAIPLPAFGAMVGVLAGNVGVLYALLRSSRPLPGLPFINAGAVVGFLLGAAWVLG